MNIFSTNYKRKKRRKKFMKLLSAVWWFIFSSFSLFLFLKMFPFGKINTKKNEERPRELKYVFSVKQHHHWSKKNIIMGTRYFPCIFRLFPWEIRKILLLPSCYRPNQYSKIFFSSGSTLNNFVLGWNATISVFRDVFQVSQHSKRTFWNEMPLFFCHKVQLLERKDVDGLHSWKK